MQANSENGVSAELWKSESESRELQTSVNKAKAQTTQKQKKKKKKEQLSNTNFDCIEEHDTEELKYDSPNKVNCKLEHIMMKGKFKALGLKRLWRSLLDTRG
ncbi:hypothetical protein DPMN_166531 [Dreissena polymorpha]|uniref:Uncharacterized protein n=1 Tax=Dreissena polymorpha TaxID=45954 RepID=A0A9D4IU86_DREPO|nr:hypothetical protein DPMN_166531 [Dreissena polymorpha]